MSVEAFIPRAREAIAHRTEERLNRQIAEILKWTDGVDNFEEGGNGEALDRRAGLISHTAEELDAVREPSMAYFQNGAKGELRVVSGTLRGIHIILRVEDVGEQTRMSGSICGEEISRDEAQKAWYLYGRPVVEVFSHAKYLTSDKSSAVK